jgi:hypothetical protein
VVVDPAALLSNCDKNVHEIYAAVSKFIKTLGKSQENASSSTINFKNGATFLVLKPKKSRMEIEFVLPDEKNEFPVYKVFRISKNRVAHYVAVEKAGEIDAQVKKWLKAAYETVAR